MRHYALFGVAMAMSAPSLAQVQTAPAPAPAAPAPGPATTVEVPPAEQVARIVDQQFATYDKDADGKLNEAEFSAWIGKLKSQTDSRTDANAPAIRQWNKAAFAQADIDRSRWLSKAEMTGLLTPPPAKS